MTLFRFLRPLALLSFPLFSVYALACGGNVVVDLPGGNGGGGAGGANGGQAGTTSISQGGVAVGGSTAQGGAIIDCQAGYTNCGNSYCADLQNDPNNCGSCGHVCGGGSFCQGGACVVPPDCVGCGQFITDGSGTLCPGKSADLYNELTSCVCVTTCVYQCSDNVCAGQNITTACQDCVLDTAAGCGNAFNECANDI